MGGRTRVKGGGRGGGSLKKTWVEGGKKKGEEVIETDKEEGK